MIKYRELMAGIAGTLLQWYDFSLFGFLAPVIAHTYFLHMTHTVALLSTFAVFAVGFLAAPLGAVVFGHIGDRYGRKRALILSIVCMTIPTSLMALLPGYAIIGIWAPIGLIVLRLLQGFVASSEFSGSALFLREHAPAGRVSLYACLPGVSYSLGLLLGGVVTGWLTGPSMPAYAWRFAFALAGLGGVLALYCRLHVEETPVFQFYQKAGCEERYPLLTALRRYPREVCRVLGIAWCVVVPTFGLYVYMSTYLHVTRHLPLALAIRYVTIALLVEVLVEPLGAIWADKIGRERWMILGSILMILLLWPCFVGLASSHHGIILGCLVLLSATLAFAFAPSNAILTGLFPPICRQSGFSVPFNIGMSLFGGTAPFIMSTLVHTHGLLAPAVYIAISLCVGIVSVAC